MISLSSEQQKKQELLPSLLKAAEVMKPLSDVFFLTSPSWLAFQDNAKEWFYAASRLSGWFQKLLFLTGRMC